MIKSQRSTGPSSLRTAAILLGVFSVAYLAREVLIPLALALTLALVLSPAVAALQKLRLGRVPAVAAVLLVTIAATGAIGWVIFNQLIEVAIELPNYQQNIHNRLEAMRTPGKGALGQATASVQALEKELLAAPTPPPAPSPTALDRAGRRSIPNPAARPLAVQVVKEPANEFDYIRGLVKPVLTPLATIGIVLIFSMFLLIKQADLRNRMFRLVGLNQLNVMTQALDDATRRVSRYLLMQVAVNFCFGALVGIGLFLIGVPYAALWGAVAGLLRFVPYIGAVVSASLPLLLSVLIFDSWTPTLMVFLLFATLELATGNFIEPYLYGAHTGISPLALLLSAAFWTVLWGPAGLILSTPLTVCVVVLGRYVPQLSFLHVLLGDEVVMAAEAHIYQRLLAMDDQEARAVADLYLSENSLGQLYDSVMIPALALAEQDRHKGALGQDRQDFLYLSVKEMLAEFSEKTAKPESTEGQTGRILILPASDEADELAAAMLAQLMEQVGYTAIPFSMDPALLRSVELAEPGAEDTLCISAVPPFAFARAIALCRQLKARYPRNKVIVGVWGFTGDLDRALRRFQPSRPERLVTNLADVVQFVADLNSAVRQPESVST